MAEEPKDSTTTTLIYFGFNGQEAEAKTHRHYYASFDDPLHIPAAARTNTTVEEWRAWWHWKIDAVADKAMKKLNRHREWELRDG